MTPISRFKKPDWQHRDPERRAAAVAGGSDREMLAELPRLAREDEDAGVRRAAVERLDDWALLAERARDDGDAAVREAARARGLARLAAAVLDDPAPAEPLLADAGAEARLKLLREAASPALRRRLLHDVDDPALLAERILKDDDDSLRARALDRLADADQLDRVVSGLKGRDKRLRRTAEDKLEALRVEAGDPEACRRRAERIVASLEAMTRAGDTDPDKRAELARGFEALPTAAREPLQRRFEGACRILEHAANPPRPEPEPEPEPETDAAEPEPQPPAGLSDETRRALEALVHEAELLAEQEMPSPRAATDLASRWERTMHDLPDDGGGEARDLHRRLDAALGKVEKRRQQAKKDRQAVRQNLDAHIEALERHLEDGDLHHAREIDHEIAGFLKQSKADQSADQRRRLAAAHRRLHELRDWQHWANNRVRKRLCEEVEALAESDLHPDAILEALKRAQKEWRELEESEKLGSEKRAYRASGPGLWKRFQAAGKRAFDRAKPFLEKRSELREHKLEEVRALIGEMEAARDREEIGDPRAVAGLLSNGRRALSRLGELPPPERGPTARKLRELLDALGKRLEENREALARDKQALIDEAAALDPEADLSQAIAQAKAIMGRWKKLETLPRGRERKLWQTLRGHLDPVFDRREAEQAEVREQRAIEQQGLESLCAELERIADLPGPELEAATTDLNRLRGQWQQHRNRPSNLEGRFRKALDLFRHRLAEQHAAQRLAVIRDTFARARLCRRLEAGELSAEETAPAWAELAGPGGDAGRAIEARRERAAAGDTADPEEQAKLAAETVLTMELIAGIDSPDEDAGARMELKVARLNQAMRGEREQEDPEEEMERLLGTWAAAGPLPADRAESLERRVAGVLKAFYKVDPDSGDG